MLEPHIDFLVQTGIFPLDLFGEELECLAHTVLGHLFLGLLEFLELLEEDVVDLPQIAVLGRDAALALLVKPFLGLVDIANQYLDEFPALESVLPHFAVMVGGFGLPKLLMLLVTIIIGISRLLDWGLLFVLVLLGGAFAEREVVQFVVLVPPPRQVVHIDRQYIRTHERTVHLLDREHRRRLRQIFWRIQIKLLHRNWPLLLNLEYI